MAQTDNQGSSNGHPGIVPETLRCVIKVCPNPGPYSTVEAGAGLYLSLIYPVLHTGQSSFRCSINQQISFPSYSFYFGCACLNYHQFQVLFTWSVLSPKQKHLSFNDLLLIINIFNFYEQRAE